MTSPRPNEEHVVRAPSPACRIARSAACLCCLAALALLCAPEAWTQDNIALVCSKISCRPCEDCPNGDPDCLDFADCAAEGGCIDCSDPDAVAACPDCIPCTECFACDDFDGIPEENKFDNIDEAIAFANSRDDIDTVRVTEGEWIMQTASTITPSITRIEGIGAPQNIRIIQRNPVFSVFEIDGAAVGGEEKIVIDGLSVIGGLHGVRVLNGAMVVLNQVYAHGNQETGIFIDESAEGAIMTNCIVWGNNTGGIRVEATAGTTEILHCSIVENGGAGVSVASGAIALVRNTLVYRNSVGLSGSPASIPNDFNFVTQNPPSAGGQDYVGGVSPDSGPVFAPNEIADVELNPDSRTFSTCATSGARAEFVAKIKLVDPISPLVDVAGPFVIEPMTNSDFESQPRPLGSSPDIGADEFDFGAAAGAWFCIDIVPDPAGALLAGELEVTIEISGANVLLGPGKSFFDFGAVGFQGGAKAVIVPEQLEALVVGMGAAARRDFFTRADVGDYTIPLDMRAVSSSGTFIGTNARDIVTFALDTTFGDVLFDGLAKLHIFVPDFLTDGGDVPQLDPNIPCEVIIDTVPPTMRLMTSGGFIATDAFNIGIEANAIVSSPTFASPTDDANSDTIFVQDVATVANTTGALFGVHAVPAFPSNIQVWRPGAVAQPYSRGLIDHRPGEDGAKIFFNIGSMALDNVGVPFVPAALNLDYFVHFSDIAPLFPEGPVNGRPRPVPAGFALEIAGPPTNIVVNDLVGARPFLPRWVVESGLGDDLQGLDGLEETLFVDSEFGDPNDHLAAQWTFQATSGDAMPFDRVTDNDFHLGIRFAATDAANNVTPEDLLLDQLHVWWIVQVQSQLSPFLNTRVATPPQFTWRLKRSIDPGEAGGSEPLFAYRLFAAVSGSDNVRNGPFFPVNRGNPSVPNGVPGLNNRGWSFDWTSRSSLPFEFFQSLVDNPTIDPPITGRWLIFLVLAADEAGNVEPWPFTLTTPNGGNNYFTNADSDDNWQRFLIPEPGELIDTIVHANFWHDSIPLGSRGNGVINAPGEPVFGETHIVPLPPVGAFSTLIDPITQRVEVEFLVQMVTDDPNRKVLIELQSESKSVPLNFDILISDTGGDLASVRLVLDALDSPSLADPPAFIGDRTRQRPQTFVFRAATFLDVDGDGIFDADNEPIDTTPANYFFTITPTVEGFVENRDSPDEQPIKILETN